MQIGNKSESFHINLPDIFDYSLILRYLQRSSLEVLHSVVDHTIFKLIPFDSENLLIQIEGESPTHLNVHLLNEQLTEARKAHIHTYISHWFDLDYDLKPFYNMARNDNLLGRIIEPLYGLRLVGVDDLFEAFCWAITGQQINLSFAYTLKQRLIHSFGEKIEWEAQDYWKFPKPEIVASANPAVFYELSYSKRKTEYLQEIARQLCEGRLSHAQLSRISTLHELEKKLTSIRGIGSWTAHYVIMRCLRNPNAFPVGDAGLQNAVKRLLSMERKPTEAELHELAAGWKGWESYATFYLWHAS